MLASRYVLDNIMQPTRMERSATDLDEVIVAPPPISKILQVLLLVRPKQAEDLGERLL